MFNTSIRENLLLARRAATRTELLHVLAIVELADWATGLPHGLDTIVGHDGELVSGGQRRRIALARALLSEAPFLILDEPAAHLDPALARRVLSNVLSVCDRRGLLIITHGYTSVDGFTRVLDLSHGTLTERACRADEAGRAGLRGAQAVVDAGAGAGARPALRSSGSGSWAGTPAAV